MPAQMPPSALASSKMSALMLTMAPDSARIDWPGSKVTLAVEKTLPFSISMLSGRWSTRGACGVGIGGAATGAGALIGAMGVTALGEVMAWVCNEAPQ